jgi:hypothetical protein
MEWEWNSNGKRVRLAYHEDSKKKRIGQGDIIMEDTVNLYKIQMQRLQIKLDREMSLYKQQVYESNYNPCCKSKRNQD